ncbi:hypothetical protein DZF91_00445 [Actinomadura logoneensis]|uniref:DUF6968 domain-containing protein n=1 Tax=Actinomadura logoneensis TaxID=2293572 RepID=A0A372JU80_9ACTN|nr:hypothetical protein [Actinomadura logoneensis]RFU43593.1 hypothetical protein DZF91_00445 [Actinomadura logoneensis]
MEVMATRRLTLEQRGGQSEVLVQLAQPQQDEHGDFVCLLEIAGLGEEHRYPSHGVDGIQALQLALKTASAVLDAHARQGATLRWNDETNLGFDS